MRNVIIHRIKQAFLLVAILFVFSGDAVSVDACFNDDYSYSILEDSTIEIDHYFGSETVFSIPEEIDGRKVTSISFLSLNALEVTIPDSVSKIELRGTPVIFHVSPNNPYFTEMDDVIFDKQMTCLIRYPSRKQNDTYVVPNGVKEIGPYAFFLCSNLSEVIIPDGVTSIGLCAFKYCDALKQINIPDSVKTIGKSAFGNCNELHQVDIPQSLSQVNAGTFSQCSSLSQVILPKGVTLIGEKAFNLCDSLREVTIPDSITYIADDAFDGCDKLVVTAERDSYAAKYCLEKEIECHYAAPLNDGGARESFLQKILQKILDLF